MQPRHSRIAPTPSGFLHEGNAFNFVLTWLLVRQSGGSLRLRIDDYDLPRVRPEYVEDIFRLLDWLGLDWDQGPQSPDDHARNFSSRHRYDLYRGLLSTFRYSGLAYSCACSKKERAKGACVCRDSKGADGAGAVAQRLSVPAGADAFFTDYFLGPKQIAVSDFTLWRKDNLPAYQLASVADDVHDGINFIVRGNDLLESTAAQIYLAKTASAEGFSNILFAHHTLVMQGQEKLSKSAGSVAMRNHYQNKHGRGLFFRRFCKWIGARDEAISAEDLLLLLPAKFFGAK